MPKKLRWDLIRILAVSGGILGIIFSILFTLYIWGPFWSFLAPDIINSTIAIVLCGIIVVGWGILGLDIWEVRYSFLTFIIVGLVLIILFGNLAGILLVIAAIPIPFGS